MLEVLLGQEFRFSKPGDCAEAHLSKGDKLFIAVVVLSPTSLVLSAVLNNNESFHFQVVLSVDESPVKLQFLMDFDGVFIELIERRGDTCSLVLTQPQS